MKNKVVEDIVNQISEIKFACITGDYAEGIDSGIINLVIVGEVDRDKLQYWVNKTEALINRKVSTTILNTDSFIIWKAEGNIESSIVLWTNNTAE